MNNEKNHVSVSVIIPIYNAGKFLRETIKSVLDQSFEDFELILIDDGSSDDSGEIGKDYELLDSRVRYIYQINSGVSIARNNGLLHANGEYVFFMDSDDTLDVDFIRSSYEVAKKEDWDIVVLIESFCRKVPRLAALPAWALMLKVEFLNRNPEVRFPEGIQPCEDGLFSHRLLALSTNIGINPNGIYHYRHHENQNHLKINESCWKVVHQIPIWFEILDQFYYKNNLLQSHALHLALFIEHEPFELRYLSMPLNHEQKEVLLDLIKTFMTKVLPYLSNEDKKKLNKPFLHFINSSDIDEFDQFYSKYTTRRKAKKKVYLFCIKFIPFRKLRRQLRTTIGEKF